MVLTVVSTLLKNKKVKKSVIKTRCEQEISKDYNCLSKKLCFQNANIRPCISPPNISPPPSPQEKFFAGKGPLTKNKPRGLLSEFYGISEISVKKKVFSITLKLFFKFNFFFCGRPTQLFQLVEGDWKRNILLGWP